MGKHETIPANEEEQTSIVQPDPETLHTADPQDEMKGPISSLINAVKKNVEEGSDDKQEANKKKEENK
jgi:hypothetical protein